MDSKQLKKRSKQGTFISIFGFLIIVFAFIIAYRELTNLNTIIASKNIEIDALDSTLNSQKETIEYNQNLINSLVDEINKLRDPTIQPNARAVKQPNIYDPEGRQIYDFTLWIATSQFTLNKIEKVTYLFKHKSVILKNKEAFDNSNGFLVSYRGWGCIPVVQITVKYMDGEEEVLYFNMCQGLDW
jgi:uncharacterized coiled-coil protein SlyX